MGLFGPTAEKVENWTATGKVKKLIGCLKSDDAVIRRLASEGLAKVGGEEVLDYCRKNGQSTDTDVRWHITQILGMIGTSVAMEVLSTVEDPGAKWDEKAKKWRKAREKKGGSP